MSDSAASATKGAAFLGALESASKFNVPLLAMAFVLLVDNLFISSGHPGVVHLATSDDIIINSSQLAIQVILIYVGFSFLLSIITPIAATIAHQAYVFLKFCLLPWIKRLLFPPREKSSSFYREQRDLGMVTSWELKEYALIVEDHFYLSLYEKNLEADAKKGSEEIKLQIYVGSCLLMWAWNMKLSSPANGAISLVLSNYSGDPSCAWGILLVLGLLMLALFNHDGSEKLIFCPAAYRHFYSKNDLSGLVRPGANSF